MADWGQKLSFYLINGKQAFKDRKLGFDATQVSWHAQGEFLLIAGSNKQCGIYTSEGIKLSTLAEKSSWVLCAKHKPNSNFIVNIIIIIIERIMLLSRNVNICVCNKNTNRGMNNEKKN